MAMRPEFAAFAGVVPDDDAAELTVLTRLQVLNTLLIASVLHARGDVGGIEVIRYEAAVLDPPGALAALARLVPEATGLARLHGGSPDAVAGADEYVADLPPSPHRAGTVSPAHRAVAVAHGVR
jgi:hypothetical protein